MGNFASLVSDHINQLLRMLSRISLTFYFENGVSHVYIRSCKLLSINKMNGRPMYFKANTKVRAAPVAERLRALFLNHLTAVSGVGSSPALAICETSQVLLAGVSGGFSRGSPVFAPPTDWPVSYELK